MFAAESYASLKALGNDVTNLLSRLQFLQLRTIIDLGQYTMGTLVILQLCEVTNTNLHIF